MTFTIRIRGDSSAPIAVEYMCPDWPDAAPDHFGPGCGRFTALVTRDADGNPPESHDCPECECSSPRIFGAPFVGTPRASVHRGKDDPRPPGMLDTRPLADGMPVAEWRAKEAKRDVDQRRSANRKRVA